MRAYLERELALACCCAQVARRICEALDPKKQECEPKQNNATVNKLVPVVGNFEKSGQSGLDCVGQTQDDGPSYYKPGGLTDGTYARDLGCCKGHCDTNKHEHHVKGDADRCEVVMRVCIHGLLS